MTFQSPELFIWKGKAYYSSDEPLRVNLDKRGNEKLGLFYVLSSCWRGYKGTWMIQKNKLFLIDLQDPLGKDIDLTKIFPECEIRVFAYWFNGKIQLPFGEIIEKSDVNQMRIDPSVYTGYHQIEFENGIIINENTLYNPNLIEE
jgi:hypothetical protein